MQAAGIGRPLPEGHLGSSSQGGQQVNLLDFSSLLSTDMGIPMRGRIQNRATGPHSKLADEARGCRRATHGRDAGSRIGKTVGICGEISHIPQW